MMFVARGAFNAPREGHHMSELLVRKRCHRLVSLYAECLQAPVL